MHVEELRERLRKLIPIKFRPYVKRSRFARAINRLIYSWDDYRFRLRRDAQTGSWVQDETERLRYSWQTFTMGYLKYRHGADRDHPSRQAAYDILKRVWEDLAARSRAKANGSQTLTVLEVPFGMGTDYEMYFSASPFSYTGMELNPKQVKATVSRLPQGDWQIGNILAIPRQDNAFNVVYCRHIFEHLSLPALELALAETLRVARDRAVFVFFDMQQHGEHESRPVRQYHYNRLSCDQLKKTLEMNSKVTDVIVHLVRGQRRYRENVIFEVMLDPSRKQSN